MNAVALKFHIILRQIFKKIVTANTGTDRLYNFIAETEPNWNDYTLSQDRTESF